MSEKDIELKPCPFCGSAVNIVDSARPWILCPNKLCYQSHHIWGLPYTEYKRQLIEKWNTRAEHKANQSIRPVGSIPIVPPTILEKESYENTDDR